MTRIRVKTKDELEKEFGTYNGQSIVPVHMEEFQGKLLLR